MSEKERLMKALFDDPTREHVNIKFFRGFADAIPEEEFCAQVSTALFQLENGLITATETFHEDFHQTDIRNLALTK